MLTQAEAIGAALDRRLMQPARFGLERPIAGRVAVDAARGRQHLAGLREHGRRPRRRVADPVAKLSGVASVAVGPAESTSIAGVSTSAAASDASNPRRLDEIMIGISPACMAAA